MRILVLGGTAWLGRTVAQEAVARGHDVTCGARGSADAPEGVAFVRVDRDEDTGLAALADTQWDAVIDVSRQPGQVRRAVRDLADWLVTAAGRRLDGAFNVTGPTTPLGEVLATAAGVAGSSARLCLVPAEHLRELGVQGWMGPASLPLWIDDPDWRGFATMDTSRARAAGLATRPLADTLRDALAWEESRAEDEPRRAGLTDDEERRVLRAVSD